MITEWTIPFQAGKMFCNRRALRASPARLSRALPDGKAVSATEPANCTPVTIVFVSGSGQHTDVRPLEAVGAESIASLAGLLRYTEQDNLNQPEKHRPPGDLRRA